MTLRKLAAGSLAAIMLASGTSALAAEDIVSITYLPIQYNGYTVDSFNGVDALYNPYSYNYQCSEYIIRYFKQTMGLSIRTTGSGPVSDDPKYSFELVTGDPKPGDVIFSSASQRGKSYNHWAMVKDYSDSVITLIEQNWRWNGQAAYERQVAYPSSCYSLYTLKSNIELDPAAPSSWAEAYITRAGKYGIIGMVTNDFRGNITRLEFCEMAVGMLFNMDNEIQLIRSGTEFSDTNSYSVKLAYRLGLVDGDAGSSFRPDDEITRQEAAVLMRKILELSEESLPGAESGLLRGLSDLESIEPWALDAVGAMLECGILTADENGRFQPQDGLTNEQALVATVRLYDYLQAQ